ncbi:DUF4269 domain-containing protein [Kiloniella litopenaei]|uniref:DUF4269 domain-containing protein n=1 Tax=Kiloniella litopenaei TaxID=1549748 RepID=UPI0006966575|nr:DUF4269 domain-containing protein [Kiloniella litopenaei]
MTADITGNKSRYEEVLAGLNLSELLADVDYEIIGTPPLGIDIADSDIDIACFSPTPDTLAQKLSTALVDYKDLSARTLSFPPYKTEVVSFTFMDWPIEFFIQDCPLKDQFGVRHFFLEKRLLSLLGSEFTQQLIRLKQQGMKTEPAFAKLLGITGDPYLNLLSLENLSDQKIKQLLPCSLQD